jgi:hypothetical protein
VRSSLTCAARLPTTLSGNASPEMGLRGSIAARVTERKKSRSDGREASTLGSASDCGVRGWSRRLALHHHALSPDFFSLASLTSVFLLYFHRQVSARVRLRMAPRKPSTTAEVALVSLKNCLVNLPPSLVSLLVNANTVGPFANFPGLQRLLC